VLQTLGEVAANRGDFGRAVTLLDESLALRRELGDRQGIAYVLQILGEVACQQGEFGRAAALLEEGLALARELGDRQGIANALTNLGWVVSRQGDYRRAAALFEGGLRLGREIGARDLLAEGVEGAAWVAVALAQPARAARLGGAAEALREALGTPLLPGLQAGHAQALQAMGAALGEEEFAAAWGEGRALPLEEAVALALEGQAEGSGGG
jgi:non-specific serine/threonine protein kinase